MNKNHEGWQPVELSAMPEKPHSCEFSVNAKGDISFKLKAYGETLAQAIDEAWHATVAVRAQVKAFQAGQPGPLDEQEPAS